MSDTIEVEVNGTKYFVDRTIHGKTQTLFYETEKYIDPEKYDNKDVMNSMAKINGERMVRKYLKENQTS